MSQKIQAIEADSSLDRSFAQFRIRGMAVVGYETYNFKNMCNNVVNVIVELELSVRKYPEILHTLYRAEWVKPNLYVKAILFALRVKDIHVNFRLLW